MTGFWPWKRPLRGRWAKRRPLPRAVWRASNIPAALAFIVICVAGLFADHQNTVLYQQGMRAVLQGKVGLIRARLEGDINGDVQLVRGLVSVVATEPDMTQARFSALAQNLFDQHTQIRDIVGAPGLVATLVYPLAGNEKVFGLDYRKNPAQRSAALLARDSGDLIIAGPVDLVQGGRGFVVRFPVFTGASDGQKSFWGIVSAVIDLDRLYHDTGLTDDKLGLDLVVTGKDASGPAGEAFFGDPHVISANPVTAEVVLPHGSWRISAVPKGGWVDTPPNAWWLRLIILAVDALVILPIVFAGRLVEERFSHVREIRRREGELGRLSRRLELALDTSKVGVWELGLADNVLRWDDRMNEIYGLPTDGGMRTYQDWQNALHPDDLPRAEAEFNRAIATAGGYHSEFRVITRAGETRTVRARGAVYDGLDDGRKIIGVNWDVSADVALNDALKRANSLSEARNAELEAVKARIEHNALHDPLTGLANRRYLDEILTRHAEICALQGGGAALLHIDLDRFKQINDTLGHAAGDAMLIRASEVLKSNIGRGDFVARIGGDEFVVVCLSGSDELRLAALAERIITEMRQPVAYQGHECRFGVSVGIATETGIGIDPKRLLVNADIALYRAKSRGRNRFEFFTDALQAEITNTKHVADEILRGLERNEFHPYYQPQFDAHTLEVVGVEALVRWHHPTRGILTPAHFLSIAEELNVVSTLDRMVLEQGLLDLRKWGAEGLIMPRLSVNVSARRLRDEELIAGLKSLDFAPGTLAFELVESIYLDESDPVVAWNIDQIKDLGIDIEIDDFGTGYASIVSLLRLKPHRMKIDRQLVMPVVEQASQRHLVGSIVEIGKSLNIEVVAEGVESMAQAAILRDIGCDILQGYALARPMPADEVAGFVLARGWREAG
jgi:diguanylate cyclase (GGDEF)-like protein